MLPLTALPFVRFSAGPAPGSAPRLPLAVTPESPPQVAAWTEGASRAFGMKPVAVHEDGSDGRHVKCRRGVTERLFEDDMLDDGDGTAVEVTEKAPFDATFGLKPVFDSSELPVSTKSSAMLADELIDYAYTATGASLRLPHELRSEPKPTLEELCAARLIATDGAALLAPDPGPATGTSVIERLLTPTPTLLAAARPYVPPFADQMRDLFPRQPPPYAASHLPVALDEHDVARGPPCVGWGALSRGMFEASAGRPSLEHLVQGRLAALVGPARAPAVNRLLDDGDGDGAKARPRPPPLDPLRDVVLALAASAPRASSLSAAAATAVEVDLDLADVATAGDAEGSGGSGGGGRPRLGAAGTLSSEAFCAVFGTAAALGLRPADHRPSRAAATAATSGGGIGAVTDRLLSSGHALRCIPVQPPRGAGRAAHAHSFVAALGDAVPGLRRTAPRPLRRGRARALRDVLDAPPQPPAPCGPGGKWEGPGGLQRFVDAALLPPRGAPPPTQVAAPDTPQEPAQHAAVAVAAVPEAEDEAAAPAAEPLGQGDLVARYLALRANVVAPDPAPAPAAAPVPVLPRRPAAATVPVPPVAAVDPALAAPPRPLRLDGLCVLVSEPFIETRPAAVAALAADHGVTCLDCPLEAPLAAVLDAFTAVAVLPLRTATTRATLKAFFRQLTHVALKFRRVWVIVVHDDPTVGAAAAAAGVADLHSTLSQFPLDVVVREAAPSALPAVLAAACDQAARAACVARDCLRSAYVARPFLAAFRGDTGGTEALAFAEHCAFLQQFPTINYFLAAQLLHAAARGSGSTLRGLVQLLPDSLPALLHELCVQHYSGRPAAMAPAARWVEQMSALLTTHCGLANGGGMLQQHFQQGQEGQYHTPQYQQHEQQAPSYVPRDHHHGRR